jgi:hypothetical protein
MAGITCRKGIVIFFYVRRSAVGIRGIYQKGIVVYLRRNLMLISSWIR